MPPSCANTLPYNGPIYLSSGVIAAYTSGSLESVAYNLYIHSDCNDINHGGRMNIPIFA